MNPLRGVRRLRKEWAAIGLVVGLLAVVAFSVYRKSDRAIFDTQQLGMLEASHQIQGNTGSNVSVFLVRLSNGELVQVTPPEMTPFRGGATVRVIESTGESGRKYYSFAGYMTP